jgi:hypothetical protein
MEALACDVALCWQPSWLRIKMFLGKDQRAARTVEAWLSSQNPALAPSQMRSERSYMQVFALLPVAFPYHTSHGQSSAPFLVAVVA